MKKNIELLIKRTHLIDKNPTDEQDKTVICERCGREFIYEEDE